MRGPWGLGGEGLGATVEGPQFLFGGDKRFWGRWRWLRNTVNVTDATELYTYEWLRWQIHVICILPQF